MNPSGPFPYGYSPPPGDYIPRIVSPALPHRDLGDDDPWNHAPDYLMDQIVEALDSDSPVVYVVMFQHRNTKEDHRTPGALNYLPRAGIGAIFWHDRSWWFYADTPHIALQLWERDAASF